MLWTIKYEQVTLIKAELLLVDSAAHSSMGQASADMEEALQTAENSRLEQSLGPATLNSHLDQPP